MRAESRGGHGSPTRRATHGIYSPNCTNPRTTATRCLPYYTTHSYLPRSSRPDSSADTHRYNLGSRDSLPVRFQSSPPLRCNCQIQTAAATSYPMDKGLSWNSSLPAYFRVQNPIPLLHSIQCRSAACIACSWAARQNRVLAWSAMRKTLSHRPSLLPRPDSLDLV